MVPNKTGKTSKSQQNTDANKMSNKPGSQFPGPYASGSSELSKDPPTKPNKAHQVVSSIKMHICFEHKL